MSSIETAACLCFAALRLFPSDRIADLDPALACSVSISERTQSAALEPFLLRYVLPTLPDEDLGYLLLLSATQISIT
jgi:hypothetical protein